LESQRSVRVRRRSPTSPRNRIPRNMPTLQQNYMGIPTPRAMWPAGVRALWEVRMWRAVTPRTEDAGLHPLQPYEALGLFPETATYASTAERRSNTAPRTPAVSVVPAGIPFALCQHTQSDRRSWSPIERAVPPEFLGGSENVSFSTVKFRCPRDGFDSGTCLNQV